MNIAINTLGPSKVKAGVGNYVCHVVHQLALLDKVNTYYIIINKDNMHQFNDLPQHFRTIRAPTLTTNKTLRILWEQIAIPYLCHTHNIDVLHSPGFVAPLFLPCRSVVTIHDMTFFTHPDVHEQSKIAYFKLMIPPTVRKADVVIADSHATHDDICRLISVPERKVRTIPLAAEMKQINVGEARDFLRDTYDITNPFILFVGMIEPRKNVKGIIEAYSRLHTDHILVVVGKLGWNYQPILDRVKKEHLENRVLFTGYVPDKHLPAFYACATTLVYPSFAEGFGIPVLEALQAGCPVITSNTSCLPEVGGNAALYVNPNDTEQIARAMQKVLNSPTTRAEMKQKGVLHAQRFSWKKCAQETLKAYHDSMRA